MAKLPLLAEAAIDDKFNVQMKKVQDAVGKLRDILADMKAGGSMTKLTNTQKMQLRHAAEDFKKLHDES
jgi:hypothetical protein